MATIRERLEADLRDAMRAKHEVKLLTIRSIKSAIKYKEVEGAAKVASDEEIINVIVTLVKQHRDAISEFAKAGRNDLKEKEEAELAVLLNYLPAQLSPDELRVEVQAAIKTANAKSTKDMAAVMKLLSGSLKGRVDGKALSQEVMSQLAAI